MGWGFRPEYELSLVLALKKDGFREITITLD